MHGFVSDDAYIKSVESRLSLRNGLDFTLPNADNVPAESGQFCFRPMVALDIAAYLLLPELDISLGKAVVAATLMAVPEATVHEYDSLVLWQDNVRLAGKTIDI